MIEWFNNLDDTTKAVIFMGLKAVVCFAIMMTMVAYTVVRSNAACARGFKTASARTASAHSACSNPPPTASRRSLKEE